MTTGLTLLVLGAGPFQVPGIRRAVADGHRVVTVDYLPDNPGHALSHASVDCSTVDHAGVLAAARTHGADGVVTFSSDVAVPTVAHVTHELGLVGPDPTIAGVLSDKARFRAALADTPDAVRHVAGGRDLQPPVDVVPLPWIVKPVDSSGSRGVLRVDDADAARFADAVEEARSWSRSGRVCVEEFIDGVEVGGDAVVVDGGVAFLAITHKRQKGFVVTGHSLPPAVDPEAQSRVLAALQRACDATGYRNGPLNFDVMVGPSRAVVLEMSARTGGNGIPAVIEAMTGVSTEAWTIDWALGLAPGAPEPVETGRTAVGSVVLGSEEPGTFLGATTPEDVFADVPELLRLDVTARPGDPVKAFTNNGALLAWAVFAYDDPSDYDRVAGRVGAAVGLRVDPAV